MYLNFEENVWSKNQLLKNTRLLQRIYQDSELKALENIIINAIISINNKHSKSYEKLSIQKMYSIFTNVPKVIQIFYEYGWFDGSMVGLTNHRS